jgi:hypothetical protein
VLPTASHFSVERRHAALRAGFARCVTRCNLASSSVQDGIIDTDDHDTVQRGLRQVRTAFCDVETRFRM